MHSFTRISAAGYSSCWRRRLTLAVAGSGVFAAACLPKVDRRHRAHARSCDRFTFDNPFSQITRCSRNIEMTPLCKIEGNRLVRHALMTRPRL
jgi:hypothetical protein